MLPFGMARWMLRACAIVVVTLVAASAAASVSVAVTWDGLLRQSTAAVVATPVEARAVWEGNRIYTYTRVRIDRAVAGGLAAGSDVWVRTMGGAVDNVGQSVDGEPVLLPGQQSLVFLHPAPVSGFDVTARGQGQFPVVSDDKQLPPHLVRSSSAGLLVRPRGSASSAPLAADVVHGRRVDDVAGDIVAAWDRTHADRSTPAP